MTKTKEIREFITKTPWEYLVNRPEVLFAKSITEASPEYFRRLTKILWRPSASLRFSTGEYFFAAGDIRRFRQSLERGGLPLLRRFHHQLVKEITALDRFGLKLAELETSTLSIQKLKVLARGYVRASLRAQAFLVPTPIAGSALETLILRQIKKGADVEKQRWLHDLVYPADYNIHVLEERAWLRMVIAIKQHPSRREHLVQHHLRTYDWVGARWFQWWNAWTEDDLKKRLRSWDGKSLSDVRHMLADNQAAWRDLRRTAGRLSRQLEIRPRSKLDQTLGLAREFAFRRAWRTDVIYRASFQAQGMLRELANRLGVPGDDLVWLTYQEFLQLMKNGRAPISIQEIRRRKHFHVTVKHQNRYEVLTAQAWLIPWMQRLLLQKSAAEIKGISAYPGLVRGPVRIVRSVKDIERVCRGDILVAVMTFPHFIAAMEKAAAFVTNEGGILCHAAIVSREMKKPCVIGSKVATNVFQDGDLVEVDANKGIVRKIPKS